MNTVGPARKKTFKKFPGRVRLPRGSPSLFLILTSLLGLYFTIPAFGKEPAPVSTIPSVQPSVAQEATSVTPKSPDEKPLEVHFVKGSLSVNARNTALKAIAEEITKKTGINISLSPQLESVLVSVKFSNIDLETGLKEIFRAAGVTNHAWVYDPSPQPRKIGKWSVKRIFVLAEGAGGDKPAPTKAPPALTESSKEPPTISDKKEFVPNRETYFDPRSNRFVEE